MNIQGVNNSNTQQSFKGFNPSRVLEKASNINSWQQRAILGVAACTFQPAIDRSNKGVDPETRRCSANRTFAKAFVGAITGVIVRAGCMAGIEPLFQKSDKFKKYVENTKNESIKLEITKLTKYYNDKNITKTKKFIEDEAFANVLKTNCKKSSAIVGTIVALGVMLFTNFLVDGPMTVKLTDYLNERSAKKRQNRLNLDSGV